MIRPRGEAFAPRPEFANGKRRFHRALGFESPFLQTVCIKRSDILSVQIQVLHDNPRSAGFRIRMR